MSWSPEIFRGAIFLSLSLQRTHNTMTGFPKGLRELCFPMVLCKKKASSWSHVWEKATRRGTQGSKNKSNPCAKTPWTPLPGDPMVVAGLTLDSALLAIHIHDEHYSGLREILQYRDALCSPNKRKLFKDAVELCGLFLFQARRWSLLWRSKVGGFELHTA